STTQCNPRWAASCQLELSRTEQDQIDLTASSVVERFSNMNCNSDCRSYAGYCELRGLTPGTYTLTNNGRSISLTLPMEPTCFDLD
ncbi:MAG: hypothetical protein AAF658_18560, partial [Myxococcota bacterium]